MTERVVSSLLERDRTCCAQLARTQPNASHPACYTIQPPRLAGPTVTERVTSSLLERDRTCCVPLVMMSRSFPGRQVPPVCPHRKFNQNITCGSVPYTPDGAGGFYRKGKDVVTIKGLSCGETAGWRCDRKGPLLGGPASHHSTPYVGDKCVRTRCRN